MFKKRSFVFIIFILFLVLTACPTGPEDPGTPQTNYVNQYYTNTVTNFVTATNDYNVTNLTVITFTNEFTNVITNIITNVIFLPIGINIVSTSISGSDLILTLDPTGTVDWVEVSVNGTLAKTLSNDYTNAAVSLLNHSAMYFTLSVEGFNPYTNSTAESQEMNGVYIIKEATNAPSIDGNPGDVCWSTVEWTPMDRLWVDFGGGYPSASDFSSRAKIVWKNNVVYVLGEVIDDVINDNYANWYDSYWEDDTFEIFIDEDNSGGDHEQNENAYAYHCSTLGDAVDINTGGAVLYNSHVNFSRGVSGTTNYWEFAVTVYDSSLNPIGNMSANKQMRMTMAYCDNDGGGSRQIFMGMNIITNTDKNVAYKNADWFGHVILK